VEVAMSMIPIELVINDTVKVTLSQVTVKPAEPAHLTPCIKQLWNEDSLHIWATIEKLRLPIIILVEKTQPLLSRILSNQLNGMIVWLHIIHLSNCWPYVANN
jgi:hypothetical protein